MSAKTVATCQHCGAIYTDVEFFALRLPRAVRDIFGPTASWRDARQECGIRGVELELRDCACRSGATLSAYAEAGEPCILTPFEAGVCPRCNDFCEHDDPAGRGCERCEDCGLYCICSDVCGLSLTGDYSLATMSRVTTRRLCVACEDPGTIEWEEADQVIRMAKEERR